MENAACSMIVRGGIGKGRGVEKRQADCLRDISQKKTGQLDGRTQVQTSLQL